MTGTRAGRLLVVGLAIALSLGPITASAYQVPSAPFTQGRTATATMPGSGLIQMISVSGQTELLDATTAGVRGSTAITYSPAIARTTPAQDIVVNTGTCAATGSCGSRGTLAVTFSQPVRNPILHLAGIGGAATQTVNGRTSAQSELHSVFKLTTAGLSLSKVGQGNNLAVTSDTIAPANSDAGPNCINTSTGGGPDAAATAACGSVQVNGIATSVAFEITAVFTKNPKLPAFNAPTSGDAVSIVASTGEDFGDAPSSYGAAWSVLSDVRLGADTTEDNATVANGATGPATSDRADDGVILKPLATTAKNYSAAVTLTGTTKAGRVCGWIDVDKSGTFQPGERACATFASKQSAVTLSWPNLPKLTAGSSYARVRVGYTAAQVEKPVGAADSGEVEDYPLAIAPPPPPVAVNDTATTPFNTGLTTDVLGNDKPGDPTSPFLPGSLCLVVGNECVQMVNVVAQGKYVAKPEGKIAFEPVPGFVGQGKPRGAKAIPDSGTGSQGNPVVVNPLLNDAATQSAVWDPGSVCLVTGPATCGKQVVVPAVGTWTAGTDGTIRLVPERGFIGMAKQSYRVADANGVTVDSQVKVTVGTRPVAQVQVDKTELPDTGGPSVLLLTLGGLLAALGIALLGITRRGRQ